MFAFLKGKAEIVLDKYNYAPGEVINGKVLLRVKKNFDSKGIVIRLSATSKVTRMVDGKSSSSYTTVYDFKQDLEKEKAYTPSQEPLEIPFTLKIPADVYSPTKTQQNIINAVNLFSGRHSQVNWSVSVKVIVRKCLTNITKNVQITVQ